MGIYSSRLFGDKSVEADRMPQWRVFSFQGEAADICQEACFTIQN